mmetsp:Transcript_63263/g.160536  ORF Transcript_63263/g.160536 Transcript_63263/m.160536 type:complete len:200 (+) Transcript_63263:173-772(+)
MLRRCWRLAHVHRGRSSVQQLLLAAARGELDGQLEPSARGLRWLQQGVGTLALSSPATHWSLVVLLLDIVCSAEFGKSCGEAIASPDPPLPLSDLLAGALALVRGPGRGPADGGRSGAAGERRGHGLRGVSGACPGGNGPHGRCDRQSRGLQSGKGGAGGEQGLVLRFRSVEPNVGERWLHRHFAERFVVVLSVSLDQG